MELQSPSGEPEKNRYETFGSPENEMHREPISSDPSPVIWRAPVAVSIITYIVAFFFFTLIYELLAGGVYVLLGGEWRAYMETGFRFNGAFLFRQVIFLLSVLTPALIWMKYADKYPLSGMGFIISGRARDIFCAIGVAGLLYLVGYPVILYGGSVEITGYTWDPAALLYSLGGFFLAAFAEEIMCRGYMLRRLMYTQMNRFVALAISSAIFSLLHFLNPNTGFVPFLNLFIAGLMLGAAYLYTSNLWFPVVLHTFWNWIQGPVLGFKVSGIDGNYSLIKLNIQDNNLINGGEFGFEGSLVCTLLMLVTTGCIILYYERKQKLLPEDRQ